ncbi:hypothetical protein [Paraburkholderia aspalathi]|uniref:hypothetical protein n=1 Tax=Paraburkholderia aspalathi TaxID=1324617 RepID=UPI001B122F43|nr:hypothetical protein [Paraburkholderia aspalathi]CAE6841851.1 hypothetical protein R20943_07150 [Paraburkholderia aspalathi]
MNKHKLLIWICAATPASVFAALPNDGVTFVAHGPYAAGAATVQPANGGVYVYSSKPVDDGRRSMRFMVGKPSRQTYDLFSAEEETALYQVRADKLAAIAAARNRARLRHVGFHAHPKLNWPKVVLVRDKTCVPQLPFASSADWKEHLVCWSAGDARVE